MSTVPPLTVPIVAEMLAVPGATLVALPALLIVATDVFPEAHVAWLVRFCVLPSEKEPVAVNCWPAPATTLGFPGVTASAVSVGGVWTVRVVVPPLTPESVAEMMVVPAPTAEAKPAVLILATDVTEDPQVAWVVRLDVLPSE